MAWEAVADLDQLEEGDMMLVHLGEPVCVIRLYEDEAVAIHNTCTHTNSSR
jgi:3-phenylpropionate/trans-cinnamate dioxygenase ferredoxin component